MIFIVFLATFTVRGVLSSYALAVCRGLSLFGATCIYMCFACGTESATNSALVLPPRVAALLKRSEVLLTRRTVVESERKKERTLGLDPFGGQPDRGGEGAYP